MTTKKATKIYNIDQLPSVMTLEEAALLLGYSADYLRKRALVGDFPGIQLFDNEHGGGWRVMKEDLQKWLEERRAKYSKPQGTH